MEKNPFSTFTVPWLFCVAPLIHDTDSRVSWEQGSTLQCLGKHQGAPDNLLQETLNLDKGHDGGEDEDEDENAHVRVEGMHACR